MEFPTLSPKICALQPPEHQSARALGVSHSLLSRQRNQLCSTIVHQCSKHLCVNCVAKAEVGTPKTFTFWIHVWIQYRLSFIGKWCSFLYNIKRNLELGYGIRSLGQKCRGFFSKFIDISNCQVDEEFHLLWKLQLMFEFKGFLSWVFFDFLEYTQQKF